MDEKLILNAFIVQQKGCLKLSRVIRLLAKIRTGVKQDEAYWRSVEKEYKEIMKTATNEEKRELRNNWAVIETMNMMVMGYDYIKHKS